MTKVEKDHQDTTSRLCSIKEAALPNGVTNKQAVPSSRQLMLQALGTQMKVKVLVLEKLAFLIPYSCNLQPEPRPPNMRLAE